MSPLHFRIAGPEDALTLSELGQRTFTETFGHLYRPEDLAAFLENHSAARWQQELADPRFIVRLGEAGGEAAAFVKLGPPSLPLDLRASTVELRQFYILKPWHGIGAAQDMMAWALAEARRRGAEEIALSVFTDNHRARAFYRRQGFEEVGTYRFMVGTHVDIDIIMRRRLD